MRYLIFLLTLPLFSQVGIGTVNPSAMLDVNGDVRVRDLPDSDSSVFVVASPDGTLGKKNVEFDIIENTHFATSPVTRNIFTEGSNYVGNIDLGLSISISIPENRKAIINLVIEVPAGTVSGYHLPNGYIGMNFYRNGFNLDDYDSKFSFGDLRTTNFTSVDMNKIITSYSETIVPQAAAQTINYSVRGFIDQIHALYTSSGNSIGYRFNMWSASGNNYGWGRAKIQYKITLL